MIIYKITNIINGKIYIGQTSESIKQRFYRHMGYQSLDFDTKFYRAVRKYGRENFVIEQIDSAKNQKELDEKEIYWINYYNSVDAGYNMKATIGKKGGDTLSNHPELEYIKEKISKSKMGGLNPNARKVKAINVITNDVFYFDSMSECQKELNLSNHSMITVRCRGKINTPYKKTWLFEYL